MSKELHIHIHPDAAVLAAIINLERKMDMNFQEALDAVNATNVTIGKISGETTTLLQRVADLQAVIDSMNQTGQTVPQELADAISALATQAKAVDDLVPDVAPPGP